MLKYNIYSIKYYVLNNKDVFKIIILIFNFQDKFKFYKKYLSNILYY
jgi:hypothetical protein